MKTYVVFRDNTEYARTVTDYMRDFERFTGKKLDTIDPDSRQGSSFCATYDIVEYPTLIAVDNTGIMQSTWRGLPLPTVNEVSYYVS